MATEMTIDPSAATARSTPSTNGVMDEAKTVAGTATAQAHEVLAGAKEQAATVADEARTQAHQIFDSASSDISMQLEQRLGSATSAARKTSEELRALAEGRHEAAGRTGDMAHDVSERLAKAADRIDELGVKGVTEEVSGFARRRPVAFLVAAGAAGLVAGQLARAVKASPSPSPAPATPPVMVDVDHYSPGMAAPQCVASQASGEPFSTDRSSSVFGGSL